jgi:hypothetical protein
MRVLRRWLLRVFATLTLLLVAALAYLGLRYHLDYGSAIARALRPTARFTIDPWRLRETRFARVLWLGFLENLSVDELSGLACSRRRDDLLWGVNDSGGDAVLFAIGTDGKDRGSVQVKGAINFDWESLDSLVLDGVPYLMISDAGDNLALRPAITFYFVPEPVLQGARFPTHTEVAPAFVLRARLEGGPEDVEAVAFDPRSRRILLLSKRAVPPVLYAIDFEPQHEEAMALDHLLLARRMTPVRGIPQPTPLDLAIDPENGAGSARPTAMDVSADGLRAVVFTYKEAYLFERTPGESWAHAFAQLPRRIRTPTVKAMEAGAFARDGRSLYMSSEYLPTPLFRFEP